MQFFDANIKFFVVKSTIFFPDCFSLDEWMNEQTNGGLQVAYTMNMFHAIMWKIIWYQVKVIRLHAIWWYCILVHIHKNWLSWFSGTQPPFDGRIHNVELCYFFNSFDTCGIQLQIRVKQCFKYIVYEPLPTWRANSSQQITGASYCAGMCTW